MDKPVLYREYHGTVLFFVVDAIKVMARDVAYSCIVHLNSVIAETALVQTLGTSWIGTTVSGLFVLIPDASKLVPHSYLSALFDCLSRRGVPVRCGVTWGPFLCFQDADDELNFVGRAINIAARLAYSADNPGCLIHERYEEYAKGFSSITASDVLEGAPTGVIKRKKHDGIGFNCRLVDKARLSVLDGVGEVLIHGHGQTALFDPGLVLAYDLPQFSEGDESQLSKRVRGLADALRSFRENRENLRKAKLYFCPGGDGGILVLKNVRQEAIGLGKELVQKLIVESEYKDSSIAVEARLGIHYGVVTLYRDAGARLRPTGTTCFIADELISDSASREAGLVFSDSLRDVISHGSERYLRSEFDELPILKSGPAAGIVRFTPKSSSDARFKHPLIEQLFGPTSSWQAETTD
jgi:hypothetical protein